MRRINKAIKMSNDKSLPIAVWSRAHLEYPKAIAGMGLYAVAFFGHKNTTGISTESVWRGCVRAAIKSNGE